MNFDKTNQSDNFSYLFSSKKLGLTPQLRNEIKDLNIAEKRDFLKSKYSSFFPKIDNFFLPIQTHSSKVFSINKKDDLISHQIESDSIVTNITNLAIGVITADCVPILLFDKYKKAIGVIHAGWRGAKDNIIENTITAMTQNFGCNLSNIRAMIGPCIRQESYQVSAEFRDLFLEDNFANKQFFVMDEKEKNKFRFNLSGFCLAKLNKIGVGYIDDVGIDTCLDERFFSYRRSCQRNEESEGRNLSAVIIG